LVAFRQRLTQSVGARYASARSALELADAKLELLNPHAALERGYAIVTDPKGGIVRDAATLAIGQAVSLTLRRGSAAARIERVEPARK